MTITAKIIADSISSQGHRLTTMQLRYPRFIHAELMTHRQFSRNASSSRAIPVERLIEDVLRDTAMPLHWGKNQPGMQAREELGPIERSKAQAIWLRARNLAVEQARKMIEIGAHKQIVNRLLEPFAHINVLVTATNYSNFFALRDHSDAQPEIMVLSQAMKKAMAGSTPQILQPGQWHLPYVDTRDQAQFGWARINQGLDLTDEAIGIRLSVARCARVSYLTHEGKPPEIEKDLALYEALVGAVPLHASPAEHQATPDTGVPMFDVTEGPSKRKPDFHWDNPHLHGNLNGWQQFRKMLPGECQ